MNREVIRHCDVCGETIERGGCVISVDAGSLVPRQLDLCQRHMEEQRAGYVKAVSWSSPGQCWWAETVRDDQNP